MQNKICFSTAIQILSFFWPTVIWQRFLILIFVVVILSLVLFELKQWQMAHFGTRSILCFKKVYWLQVKIFLSKMKSRRPPFTASDPMKVYNIILRGFDQIDVPRHVNR